MTEARQSARMPILAAVLAGVVAGGLGIGLSELVAGLVPGAPSPILAIGNLIIKLQPPNVKQLVVDLFGEADKLVLNGAVLVVALAIGAGLGLLARRSPPVARAGFAGLGIGVLGAAIYADPTVELLPAAVNAAIGAGAAMLAIGPLVGVASGADREVRMLDFDRRRFIGRTIALAGVAVVGGTAGRLLLDRRAATAQSVPAIPAPASTAVPVPAGARLDVPGISELVTPNPAFYRIDTALLIPRPDVTTWHLSVDGMVERPFSLDYAELVAMPLVEQYVTIACVSNEVGGNLVGNALWRGVPLRTLLDRAGVRDGATQIVGESVDGFTAGFPTAWVDEPDRKALVAVAMNGEQLPPEHGFPARLIVPGLYGYVSATKWLSRITLTTLEGFNGYWVPLGWAKEAPILTQSRIDVPRSGNALVAGPVAVAGVAWAPDRGVAGVEVQVDDGPWVEAGMSAPISGATWVQWLYRWDATAGDHTLRVRATDGTGEVQTDRVTRPPPDGARGHHTIGVSVG